MLHVEVSPVQMPVKSGSYIQWETQLAKSYCPFSLTAVVQSCLPYLMNSTQIER